MLNALTIDVEDYFQVHAFSNVIKYENWDNYECRIEDNTCRILEILNEFPQTSSFKPQNSVKATFFILGWIAERYSHLIKEISLQGHEIASHGYNHKLIYHQTKEEFRNDIRKSKAVLEDITGIEIIGYRAPSYSITNKSRWAFEVLIEEGFEYDSSIFPIRHDFYGMPNAPRFPFIVSVNGNSSFEFSMLNHDSRPTLSSKSIIEFPTSTIRIFGQNLPISGGGYFRLFPFYFTKRGLMKINRQEKKPFVFYIHPWELDSGQPKIRGAGFKSKFRHYNNLDRTEMRFKKLLKNFQFATIREVIGQYCNIRLMDDAYRTGAWKDNSKNCEVYE